MAKSYTPQRGQLAGLQFESRWRYEQALAIHQGFSSAYKKRAVTHSKAFQENISRIRSDIGKVPIRERTGVLEKFASDIMRVTREIFPISERVKRALRGEKTGKLHGADLANYLLEAGIIDIEDWDNYAEL